MEKAYTGCAVSQQRLITGGAAATTEVGKRPPEVIYQLDELRSAVSGLEEEIGCLISRLRPVLNEQEPARLNTVEIPDPSTPLACSLHDIVSRLRGLIRSTKDANTCLEI